MNGHVLIPHFARTHTFSSGRETQGAPHLGTMTRKTELVLDENLITTYGRARPSLSIMIDLRNTFPSLRTASVIGQVPLPQRTEVRIVRAPIHRWHPSGAVLRMTNIP